MVILEEYIKIIILITQLKFINIKFYGMDFNALFSRPFPDASQDTFKTRNNFLQIKEKNMIINF